jgi:hypothetical protein
MEPGRTCRLVGCPIDHEDDAFVEGADFAVAPVTESEKRAMWGDR